MGDPHARAPHACPRCGYDLSGETRTWETQCPTDGICSECGLAFKWRDIFLTERLVHRWFIEHRSAPGSRPLDTPRRALRTLLMLAWPIGLWRSIRLEHRLSLGRLSLFTITITLLSLAAIAASHLLYDWSLYQASTTQHFWYWSPSWKLWEIERLTSFGGLFQHPASWHELDWLPIVVFTSTIFALVFPASLCLLPVSLARLKLKPTHLVRITLISISTTMLWLAIYAPLRTLAYTEFWALHPSTRPHGPWANSPPAWLHVTTEFVQRPIEDLFFRDSVFLYVSFTAIAVLPTLSAIIFYLRLNHQLLVATLMLTLSILLSCTISFFLGPFLTDDLSWTAW